MADTESRLPKWCTSRKRANYTSHNPPFESQYSAAAGVPSPFQRSSGHHGQCEHRALSQHANPATRHHASCSRHRVSGHRTHVHPNCNSTRHRVSRRNTDFHMKFRFPRHCTPGGQPTPLATHTEPHHGSNATGTHCSCSNISRNANSHHSFPSKPTSLPGTSPNVLARHPGRTSDDTYSKPTTTPGASTHANSSNPADAANSSPPPFPGRTASAARAASAAATSNPSV